MLVELGSPLAGAAGVARGRHADRAQRGDVLLALDDHYRASLGDVFDQLGQAVRDLLNAVEVPDPSALAVRSALAKIFRIVLDDLESELTVWGVVVERRDDPAEAARAVGRPVISEVAV